MRVKILSSFLLLLFISLSNFLILPIKAEYTAYDNLSVDSWIPQANEWNKYGDSPYLDTLDNDTSYIWTPYETSQRTDQYYTFENITPRHPTQTYRFNVTSIINATIYVWCRATSAENKLKFSAYLWNGSYYEAFYTSTSDQNWHYASDIAHNILDTPEEIENARVKLQTPSSAAGGREGRISYVYMLVWFTYTEEYIYPLRLILGLFGLVLMVASPTIGVREVLKNKNLSMIGGCIIAFAIGYGMVHVWLIP